MSANVTPYLDLVQRAYQGELKLPAFQRKWKWNRSQVTLLYDSLRRGYPIGSFLFIEPGTNLKLAPRPFQCSSQEAANTSEKLLVLDGQQRITAGLELFFPKGDSHYYLDLNHLQHLFQTRGHSLKDPEGIIRFVSSLDIDDEYIVPRPASGEPFKNLHSKHLLSTQLLHPDNFAQAYTEYKKYKENNPGREEFIELVIRPYFVMDRSPAIPLTVIEKEYGVESISRIFATLNRTGKLLTPFELVVAVLFPHDIDLNDDLDFFREQYPIYEHMDSTGELLLQTIALYNGDNPKKSLLPQTIDKVSYKKYSEQACVALDSLGKFLSERLGVGLNVTGDLVPYDAIFPPMAIVYEEVVAELKGKALQHAMRKLERWFVGAALANHYQRSTHDRQVKDRKEMLEWVLEAADELQPRWLKETNIPSLASVIPGSALGKICRCLMNRNEIHDPLTKAKVGIKPATPPTNLHHIFPKKFVPTLDGWTERDSADLLLNVMYVEQATNTSWLREDPGLQVKLARQAQGVASAKKIYAEHGISDTAIAILERENKGKADFEEFIAEREKWFIAILSEYGFSQGGKNTDEGDSIA